MGNNQINEITEQELLDFGIYPEKELTIVNVKFERDYELFMYVKNSFFEKYPEVSTEINAISSREEFRRICQEPFEIGTYFHRDNKPAYILINKKSRKVEHVDYWNNGKRISKGEVNE